MEYEILLVNISRHPIAQSSSFQDCIGHYLIAAYLRQRDFVAQVYSGSVQDTMDVLSRELGEKHVGIVGFYAAADNIDVVAHTVRWVKKTFQAITVIGGPQAIALDEDFFISSGNDYAIIGEGEIPIYKLLSVLIDQDGRLEDVPSLIYRTPVSGQLIQNPIDGATIDDLDSIPFPHIEDSLTRRLRMSETAGIITGRGCPNHCTFCYEGGNSKYVRFRSIENVMEEIDYVQQNNPHLKYLNVYDDTFTLNPERVLHFCAEIKKRKIHWFCEGHVSFVVQHPDILRTMVDSGLACIQFGIESGSQKVLDAYHKRTNRAMILDCIRICKEAGLHNATGNFIIGGAWESKETLQESMSLAAEMLAVGRGIVELYTVYFAPYPHTEIERTPETFGLSIDSDRLEWNLHTMRSPVVHTQMLTSSMIHDAKEAFDSFLDQHYSIEARQSTKQDFLQSMCLDGHITNYNPNWRKAFSELPYYMDFLNHCTAEEQRFDPNKYMIRTFEDYKLEGNLMTTPAGIFSGTEKDILLYSTGKLSVNEVASRLNLPLEIIQQIFFQLNNRCLLYMSWL